MMLSQISPSQQSKVSVTAQVECSPLNLARTLNPAGIFAQIFEAGTNSLSPQDLRIPG